MLIRNNTNRKLVFYFGNPHDEEPELVVSVKVGESLDLDKCPKGDVSIQGY